MFSLLESALCLWIQVHPLWIQGLKRLVLWSQNLTLLEDQGLWIQAIVLHCSCAKAASLTHSVEYHLGTINIYNRPWKLQLSFCRSLTQPRRFTFAFVTSVSNTCMLSELYFHDFCVVFSWVKSLGRPFSF